jgi:hypothetical protein
VAARTIGAAGLPVGGLRGECDGVKDHEVVAACVLCLAVTMVLVLPVRRLFYRESDGMNEEQGDGGPAVRHVHQR